MNTDIFSIIKTSMNGFTKGEKKVAQYVLAHPAEVMNMSISDLSDECGTGDTTVFRFCRTLNLNGYQDFKMRLAQSVSMVQQPGNIEDEARHGDGINWVCKQTLENNIAALNETYSLLDLKKIEQAVTYISQARIIRFFGLGASYLSAQEAHYKFLRITDNTSCVMDSHFQTMAASLMTDEDVAVLFTHSGSSKDAIQILDTLQKTGCRIISITRFKKSPATERSDIVLLCGDNETPLQGGSASARIAQLYIIDVIYHEYCRQNPQKTARNRVATSSSITDKLL